MWWSTVSKAFFRSTMTPHENKRLSMFVCMAFTMSRIACWVECAFRTEAILRRRKQIVLLNERFHSTVHQSFKYSVKVGQERNRSIVIWVWFVIWFINRYDLCHFSFVWIDTTVEMDRFKISARMLLIILDGHLSRNVGQEYKPWDLWLGIREISSVTSVGVTKLKAKELIGA